MDYLIIFLNGILTFISPCLLPMLPIYISYLTGNIGSDTKSSKTVITNAFGFVAGFSIIFIILGFLSSTFGKFIIHNVRYFHVFGGIIIILFGLHFANIIKIPLLNKEKKEPVF